MIVKYGIDNRNPGKQPFSFSITATIYRNASFNTDDRYFLAGGCLHNEIERYCPGQFSDLIRFHLRHEDGSPMYPVENGMYYVNAAILGKSSKNHLTEEEGKRALAEHLLFSDEETAALLAKIIEHPTEEQRKNFLTSVIEKNRSRWKAAARRLKTKYNFPDFEVFD